MKIERYNLITRQYKVEPTSTAPKYGAVSCDTGQCVNYLDYVNRISEQLHDFWLHKATDVLTKKTDWPEEKQQDFIKDYNNWVILNKNPWDNKLKARLEDCDSVLPGPCKDAINSAESHETRVYEYARLYEKHTGEKTGIQRPKDPVSPKTKDKDLSLFPSIELSTSTKIFLAAAVFGGIYFAATRK